MIYLLWKAEKRRRRSRPRVQRVPQRRPPSAECHPLLQELRLDDGRFQRYFRLSRSQFEELLTRVGARISLRDSTSRRSVPAEERLSICLRYLATGESYRIIADSFRVEASTVGDIVPQVVTAIWDSLVGEFMAVPTAQDWRAIAEDFRRRWNFPLCCGAVDGKYVQMEVPSNSGSSNCQRDFSIVLLAVVDARYRFRMIDVGGYCRNGDGSILANSAFGQALLTGTLDLPGDQYLPGAVRRGIQPFVFVADEEFPLKKNMMRPFPGRGRIGLEERVFNYRVSRARLVLEEAFGALSSHWRWYSHLADFPTVSTEDVEQCMKASCVLLNFMRDTPGREASAAREAATGGVPLRDLGRAAANNFTKKAKRVRDAFNGHFMAEGAVPWQPTE